MIAAQEVDFHRVLVGGGYYFVSIAGVVIMSYYAVKSFRSDIDKVAASQEKIEKKMDGIQGTLTKIQNAQERGDQSIQDIRQRVGSIEGRVTYLERQP